MSRNCPGWLRSTGSATYLTASELATETLQEITALTVISFPQAIVPNKLLQEMRELAKQANLDLPLVMSWR